MLGIILTGHGHFATGLQSSIELIAGEQEKFIAVNFEEGMSAEQLQKKLREAYENLDTEAGVVIFSDLPGGTPFNQSVLLSKEIDSVRVIAGINIPSLMEGLFTRNLDIDSFIETVLNAGKNGIVTFEQKIKKAVTDIEDGI